MEVSGVVILYYPNEEELVRNIRSYIEYVGSLIVFSNFRCAESLVERVISIDPKIIFIVNQENEGIARPLNRALEYVGNKSNWLLTMDQDSHFDPVQASIYFHSFERLFSHSKDVAIVCPDHSKHSRSCKINDEYSQVVRAITSGSIINTQICKQLNGFEEKLFIDDVDHEYCYRCITAGYRIIQFSNIYLNHSLGTQRDVGYFSFFKKSGRSIHSPFRIYYMVRNFLYVSRKYKIYLPEEMRLRKKELFVILKNNLLFSGKFFEVLVAAIKGYLHFKLNKFSS